MSSIQFIFVYVIAGTAGLTWMMTRMYERARAKRLVIAAFMKAESSCNRATAVPVEPPPAQKRSKFLTSLQSLHAATLLDADEKECTYLSAARLWNYLEQCVPEAAYNSASLDSKNVIRFSIEWDASEDADDPILSRPTSNDGPCCLQRNPGSLHPCCKIKGHEGSHVSLAPDGSILAEWEGDDPHSRNEDVP